MPYYLNPNLQGLKIAASQGNGNSINLKWNRSFPITRTNKIAYNIYVSAENLPFEVRYFNMSPTFVSVDGSLTVDIIDLTPGQMYWFAVRAVEYDESFFDLKTLPQSFNGLRIYPESSLRENITATDLIIPLIDTEQFPSSGVVKIGIELIQYSTKNDTTNNLSLTSILQRGYNNTTPTIHNTDGYDGYVNWYPFVLFSSAQSEEQNTIVYECQNRFDVENFSFTQTDGYRQRTKDILTTDLSNSDAFTETLLPYDYSGYHRTDPVALFRGDCVGSYFGGTYGCADGYEGVGMQVRGGSVQEVINQREEELLSLTGEPVVLVKRQWTGIQCKCIIPSNEYPDARCNRCYGVGFVVGYNQYFNPKRSDGKILVRFDPAVDDLKMMDSGLESDSRPTCWTTISPSLRNRDFIIRFDQDGNEEFRYEILNVTRNKTFLALQGAQKFAVQRIRKTDIIYQVRVFRDTSMFPIKRDTTLAASNGISLHKHNITINEKNISNFSQITSIDAGHSHTVRFNSLTGILDVSVELGHTHQIIL